MNDGSSDKTRSRSTMLGELRAMSPEHRDRASKLVRDRLEAFMETRKVTSVLGFASLGTEPDITPLLGSTARSRPQDLAATDRERTGNP